MNVLDAVKQAGAGFRSLKDSWADTTTARRTLVVTILGGLAEFERSLIRARPGKGRERAKARRRSVRTAAEVHSAPEAGGGRAFKAGEAVMEIARTFGVDRATIYSPE